MVYAEVVCRDCRVNSLHPAGILSIDPIEVAHCDPRLLPDGCEFSTQEGSGPRKHTLPMFFDPAYTLAGASLIPFLDYSTFLVYAVARSCLFMELYLVTYGQIYVGATQYVALHYRGRVFGLTRKSRSIFDADCSSIHC